MFSTKKRLVKKVLEVRDKRTNFGYRDFGQKLVTSEYFGFFRSVGFQLRKIEFFLKRKKIVKQHFCSKFQTVLDQKEAAEHLYVLVLRQSTIYFNSMFSFEGKIEETTKAS